MVITAAASTGFIVMKEETDGLNLWQPTDSDFVKNIKWLRENIPSRTRVSSILFLSDNFGFSAQIYLTRAPILADADNDTAKMLLPPSSQLVAAVKVESLSANCQKRASVQFSPGFASICPQSVFPDFLSAAVLISISQHQMTRCPICEQPAQRGDKSTHLFEASKN